MAGEVVKNRQLKAVTGRVLYDVYDHVFKRLITQIIYISLLHFEKQ
jgi:hypothetical protein